MRLRLGGWCLRFLCTRRKPRLRRPPTSGDQSDNGPGSEETSDETLRLSNPVSRISPAGEFPLRAKRYVIAFRLAELRAYDPAIIAQEIIAACSEVSREGGVSRADVAVRLMVTQLARGCAADRNTPDYDDLMTICRMRSTSW